MSLFNLKYPTVQAPATGPAGPELAIAVASAGAMSALGLTWDSPGDAYELVKQVKAGTNSSFFVNYVLNFEPTSLDKALEAGATTVQFSWGMPNQATLAKVREAGAKLGIQVTSRDSAKRALDLDAEYLVCQGTEAGGHVQASRPLGEALEEVLDIAGDRPVLASGGLATGHDIRRMLSLGAAGAVLGTRFVATRESLAHQDYKKALLDSNQRDTVFTTCLSKGWENATHRILPNGTFTMWEAAVARRRVVDQVSSTYSRSVVRTPQARPAALLTTFQESWPFLVGARRATSSCSGGRVWRGPHLVLDWHLRRLRQIRRLSG